MRQFLLTVGVVAVAVSLAGPLLAQQAPGKTVSLFIFESRLRSFAPGLEAVISLNDEQKKKLGGAYDEVFGTSSVRLASSVLQDMNASLGQRRMASATMVQAQAAFRAKSRAIFSDPQRELIDKVYEAFNRIYQQAQEEVVKQITASFSKELEKLLTPEQKAAMAKSKAEIEAAQAKPAAGTPPAAGTQPAPKPNGG